MDVRDSWFDLIYVTKTFHSVILCLKNRLKDETRIPLYSFVQAIVIFRLLSSYILKEKWNHPQAIQEVDEFVSSEQIYINLALCYLLINESSAVN